MRRAAPARGRPPSRGVEGRAGLPFKLDVRAVTVPGCVDGWLALHDRYGRLELAEVLAPAIRYAADGFPASAMLAAMVPLVVDRPGADDFRVGASLRPGDRVRRPGVARALQAVVAEGRDGFYLGEFGQGVLEVGAGGTNHSTWPSRWPTG